MPAEAIRPTLIIPGLGDSGPAHWQTWLEGRLPKTRRVIQPDWGLPDLDAWSRRIADAIDACTGPPTIVAHSFGVLATVHAHRRAKHPIAAAMLVTPPDPDIFGYADLLCEQPLPFPSLLVASRNDPWMAYDRTIGWGERWGCRIIDAGYVAHINADSGHGRWPQGLQLLNELERSVRGAKRLVAHEAR
jgi:predicted alpha/beta hydrolase family esterase